MITPPQLWTQYVSRAYPQGASADQYRHIKGAFYSGLLCLMTKLDAIDAAADVSMESGMEIMRRFHEDIRDRVGFVKADFEDWLTRVYTSGTTTQQLEQMWQAFAVAMQTGLKTIDELAGPSDEDDDLGAARLRKLRSEVIEEMSRIVGLA